MTASRRASSFVGLPVTRDLTLAYALSLLVAILIVGASAADLVVGSAGLHGVERALVELFVGQDAANIIVGLPMLLGSVAINQISSCISGPSCASCSFFSAFPPLRVSASPCLSLAERG